MNKPIGKKNIVYETNAISNYFSQNRIAFKDFYKSEKNVLEKINWFDGIKILDVGCGCGGLGLALKQEFSISNYVGVDIHSKSIELAKKMNQHTGFRFINQDFLELQLEDQFDIVISFSCVDWNVETESMISKCWNLVKPGGKFIATFRLSNELQSIDKQSFQYINYEGEKKGEKAPYVVMGFQSFFDLIKTLNCSNVELSGYFNKPSSVAITNYSELFFCCVCLSK